jgi:hypothetical protein
MPELVKIVVFVPEDSADVVREALGQAGAGTVGNYTFCSFSTKGVGRFLPGQGAHPAIGTVGTSETVPEERIEVICEKTKAKEVVAAMKKVHPYEEVAFDVYPLVNLDE